MRSSRNSAMVAAAMMMAAMTGGMSGVQQARAGDVVANADSRANGVKPSNLNRSIQYQSPMQALFGGFGSCGSGYRAPGPGWTQAQQQRRARKARNVKANRRAQRRARSS